MARELGFSYARFRIQNLALDESSLERYHWQQKNLSTKMSNFIMIHIIIMEKYLAPSSNFRYFHFSLLQLFHAFRRLRKRFSPHYIKEIYPPISKPLAITSCHKWCDAPWRNNFIIIGEFFYCFFVIFVINCLPFYKKSKYYSFGPLDLVGWKI